MLDRVEADIDRPLLETGFAIAEVVIPEAAETVVEAKRGNGRPAGVETGSPFGKRSRVGLAKMLDLSKYEACLIDSGGQCRIGWQKAARKNVFLDEVGAAAVALVASLLYRNYL